MNKDKYENISRETIINEKTVLQLIEESKNLAIKNIMRIIDNNIDDERDHKHTRGVVLDELNDMARSFADILERVYK